MAMSKREAKKQIKAWVYATDDIPPRIVAEALDMAMDALEPVSQEDVQKVWAPCSFCSGALNLGGKITAFYPMNNAYPEESTEKSSFDFCPVCGRPMTEAGLEMVMEKLEKLNSND